MEVWASLDQGPGSLALFFGFIYLFFYMEMVPFWGFPDGSVVKNPHANAGDTYVSLIPGSGRSPGEGNGNPLQ